MPRAGTAALILARRRPVGAAAQLQRRHFGGTVGHIAVCAKTWLVRGAAGRGCIFFIGGKNPKLGSHALARLAVHAEPIAEQELTVRDEDRSRDAVISMIATPAPAARTGRWKPVFEPPAPRATQTMSQSGCRRVRRVMLL
jgi:hypothetical protein